MKLLKKICLLTLTIFTAVCALSLSAGAQSAGYDNAKPLEPNALRTLSNTKKDTAERCIKLTLPDAGELVFFAAETNTNAKTKYTLSNEKGKETASGRFSALISKPVTIKKAGTYYLSITLKNGQYIKRLCYTFTAKNGKKIKESLSLTVGASAELTDYTKGFGGSILWFSSDESVAKVSTKGRLTALKSGKATISAYASDGSKAEMTVTVKEDKSALSERQTELLCGIIAKTASNRTFFQQGQLTETIALYSLYSDRGLIDGTKAERETNRTILSKVGLSKEAAKFSAERVDALLSEVYGIKPSHTSANYCGGSYYYPYGKSTAEKTVRITSKKVMSDGKMIACCTADGEKLYALLSSSGDGIRLYAVCDEEQYALRPYNMPETDLLDSAEFIVEYEGEWRLQTIDGLPVSAYAQLTQTTVNNVMVTVEIFKTGQTIWQNAKGKEIIVYSLRRSDFFDGYTNYVYNMEKDTLSCSYAFNDGTKNDYVLMRGKYKFS